MKRTIICLSLLMLSCISIFAADLDFISQSFAGKTYLVVKFQENHSYGIINNTMFNFFLKDGTTYLLKGQESNKHSEGMDDIRLFVIEVTPEMRAAFKKGVKGVAINTVPEIFKKKYSDKHSFDFLHLINEPTETDRLD